MKLLIPYDIELNVFLGTKKVFLGEMCAHCQKLSTPL